MAPSSPKGCTIITPGDRARRAREPKVDGTQEPAPRGRHKRSLVESFEQPFPLAVVAPFGRGFWGESLPRVASCSALPHPGLFLCGAPRRKSRPDKYQQVLNESSQKQNSASATSQRFSHLTFSMPMYLSRQRISIMVWTFARHSGIGFLQIIVQGEFSASTRWLMKST